MTDMYGYPLVGVTNVFLDFLQDRFANPEIVPSPFRWNEDEDKTLIYITAPYSVTRKKVGTKPTVTVQRSGFNFRNMVLNNFESSDAITFENKKHRDLLDGVISIVCEAGTDIEATGLANFVALIIQSDRHMVASVVNFIHEFKWNGISEAVPVKEENEITRWQCTISFRITLQLGWITRELETVKFNQLNLYAYDKDEPGWESTNGVLTAGSPNLVDGTADFGFLTSNNPQLLEAEYDKKWYFIVFDTKKYMVEEIVNNYTLKLSDIDADGNKIDFNPTESGRMDYELVWDSVHVNIELKKE